jgi:tRNA (uracil-5-)-methyltransferase TRM9
VTDEDDHPPDAARDPARVRAVYDEIAAHFAKTRAYPWPEVEEFLDGTDAAGSTVDGTDTADSTVDGTDAADSTVGLDLGCGNGRHAAVLADVVGTVLAVDVSRELLGQARERMARDGWSATLLQGDAARLPVATDTVDVGLYVATLHHLPNREARVGSLDELARALAPGGRALVSAWSTAHGRFEEVAADIEDAADSSTSGADTETGFDTTIDWTLPGDETVERFYHIYAPAEFDADLAASALTVEETFLSSGNCYAVVRG